MAMSLVSLANGCRLCLTIGPDNLDIFIYDKQKKSLLKNIWKYFSIQVLMEDFFPKKICRRCIGEIERFTAFSAEVDQVQKRMQNMVACIPPDFHRSIVAQNNNVADLSSDPLKVESDSHIADNDRTALVATENRKPVPYGVLQTCANNAHSALSAAENRKPVAYGILQTQPNNPNPVMSLLIMGDDSANNPSVQPQLLNSNPMLPFMVSDNKDVQNNANVVNPNPLMPLLLPGSNTGLQSVTDVQTQLPLIVTGGNIAVQNNKANSANVQTPIMNHGSILPFLLKSSNTGVKNSKVNTETQFLNSNEVMPLLPSLQNKTKPQRSLLKPNPLASSLAGVQNIVYNTGVPTQFLNTNQKLPLLPLRSNKHKKVKNTKPQILPLLLGAGDSSVQNNKVNQISPQAQYFVHNPMQPWMVVGSNPNVQDTKMNNTPTEFVNPNSIPQFLVINGDATIANNVGNPAVPLNPLEKPLLVVSGNSEVQNEKISSTNTELPSEDSRSSRECSSQNMTATNNDASKTETPPEDGSNNAEGGPENEVEKFRSLAEDPDFCTARDIEMAAFYNFSCFRCEEGKTFKKYALLDKHCLAEHGNNAVVSCCNRELVGEANLVRHMRQHRQRVKCPECGKELSMRWSLKYHMLRHLPQERRPFKCKKCGKGFAMQSEVQKHQTVHLTENERGRHVCDICGKTLSTAYSVLNHQLYFHQRVQKAMCHICPKTFSTVSALKIHLTSHYSKPQSEKCPECGKMLKNKMTLRSHMLLHNSKKTYPCPHCDKVCRFTNRLREHLRCHQDLWPHQCTFCKKLFKRKAGLQAHIVVHTGEQPYQCPYCSRTFASKSNYYSHKQRMHIRRNANKKPDTADKKTKVPKRKKGNVRNKKKKKVSDNEESNDSDSATCNRQVEAADCNVDANSGAGDTDVIANENTDKAADGNIPEEGKNRVKSENDYKDGNYGIADVKKYYTRNGNEYEMANLNKYEMVAEEEEYSVADMNKANDAAEDSKFNLAEER